MDVALDTDDFYVELNRNKQTVDKFTKWTEFGTQKLVGHKELYRATLIQKQKGKWS